MPNATRCSKVPLFLACPILIHFPGQPQVFSQRRFINLAQLHNKVCVRRPLLDNQVCYWFLSHINPFN